MLIKSSKIGTVMEVVKQPCYAVLDYKSCSSYSIPMGDLQAYLLPTPGAET